MKVILLLLIGKFQEENNMHEEMPYAEKKNSCLWLEDGGGDNGILILARWLLAEWRVERRVKRGRRNQRGQLGCGYRSSVKRRGR